MENASGFNAHFFFFFLLTKKIFNFNSIKVFSTVMILYVFFSLFILFFFFYYEFYDPFEARRIGLIY